MTKPSNIKIQKQLAKKLSILKRTRREIEDLYFDLFPVGAYVIYKHGTKSRSNYVTGFLRGGESSRVRLEAIRRPLDVRRIVSVNHEPC